MNGRNNNRRRRLWFFVAIALVIVAFGFYWLEQDGESEITYQTEKVDRGNITVTVSATGTINADTTVDVGSQISGRIAKLYVDYNSVVKNGQVIAQLDPTFLQAAVDQERANVEKAQAQYADALRTYTRTKELFAKSLAAQSDLDSATASMKTAKATLSQAEAALKQAQVNLQYATIRAPISGVVISRNVNVGQTVAASLQAPTLYQIANDLHKMQVQASVGEADIGSVKVGQDVAFRVDAYPNDVFHGTVQQIRYAPVTVQNVVTYNVIIDVANPELKLMPGMTATVTIVVVKKDDVVRIPLQAILFTPLNAEAINGSYAQGNQGESQNQDNQRVWVLNNGKPSPRYIKTGLEDNQYVQVVSSNLTVGENVIVGSSGGGTIAANRNPFLPQFSRNRNNRNGRR